MSFEQTSPSRVSFAELLGHLQVKKGALHSWVKSGDLVSFKVGRTRYFTDEQIVAFVLKRSRVSREPHERERIQSREAERLHAYLRACRSGSPDGDRFSDLVKRVERIEQLLETRTQAAA
jgi:hypothetical protein